MHAKATIYNSKYILAAERFFQQYGILTSVDSDEPVQPPFKLRNSENIQAYAQADLRLCWSHIPHCWKSQVAAHWSIKKFIPLHSNV